MKNTTQYDSYDISLIKTMLEGFQQEEEFYYKFNDLNDSESSTYINESESFIYPHLCLDLFLEAFDVNDPTSADDLSIIKIDPADVKKLLLKYHSLVKKDCEITLLPGGQGEHYTAEFQENEYARLESLVTKFEIDQSSISPTNLAYLKIGECVKVWQLISSHNSQNSKEIVFECRAKLLRKTITSNKPRFELQLITD